MKAESTLAVLDLLLYNGHWISSLSFHLHWCVDVKPDSKRRDTSHKNDSSIFSHSQKSYNANLVREVRGMRKWGAVVRLALAVEMLLWEELVCKIRRIRDIDSALSLALWKLRGMKDGAPKMEACDRATAVINPRLNLPPSRLGLEFTISQTNNANSVRFVSNSKPPIANVAAGGLMHLECTIKPHRP